MALPERTTRRQFAGSVAAVVGAGLAGCTRDASGIGGSQPEDTPIARRCERENQELPDLSVRNKDSGAHTVTVVVDGVREDGTTEPVYVETFTLEADRMEYRGVAFDPDREDIERFEDYVATATTEDGQSDSDSVYNTVVSYPLRYTLDVKIEPNGELVVAEMHWDTAENWDPAC